VPIGCHDRSSSVVVSATPVRRPLGQTKGRDDTPPFGLSQRMDCELELRLPDGPRQCARRIGLGLRSATVLPRPDVH
jgi:hypothetical protein